jgi:hypothetical protein
VAVILVSAEYRAPVTSHYQPLHDLVEFGPATERGRAASSALKPYVLAKSDPTPVDLASSPSALVMLVGRDGQATGLATSRGLIDRPTETSLNIFPVASPTEANGSNGDKISATEFEQVCARLPETIGTAMNGGS